MFYNTEFTTNMFSEQETSPINDENQCVTRPTTKPTTKTLNNNKPNKQLPEKAIRLMNAWYLAHEDNPYPNRQDLDYLATNGGIKESQVKAWFSNKRNRTQNTHPKRAKRYLVRNQLQSNASNWEEPEKIHIADQLEQRVQEQQQQQQHLLSTPTPIVPYPQWSWFPSGHAYDYSSHYYYHHQQQQPSQ